VLHFKVEIKRPASSTNADLFRLHNPEPANGTLRLREGKGVTQEKRDGSDVLLVRTQHDDTWHRAWSILTDVGEVEVEGDENAILASADGEKRSVSRTPEAFLLNRGDIDTAFTGERGRFAGQVLVELEAKLRHSPGSSGWNGQYALARKIRRVRDSSWDVLGFERRVLIQDAFL